MQVRFLQPAQYELDEAVEYYNAQVLDLGRAFLLEVLAGWNVFASFQLRGIRFRSKPGVAN